MDFTRNVTEPGFIAPAVGLKIWTLTVFDDTTHARRISPAYCVSSLAVQSTVGVLVVVAPVTVISVVVLEFAEIDGQSYVTDAESMHKKYVPVVAFDENRMPAVDSISKFPASVPTPDTPDAFILQ